MSWEAKYLIPRVLFPPFIPSNSKGKISPLSNKVTNHLIGLTNLNVLSAHFIDFSNSIFFIAFFNISGKISLVFFPAINFSIEIYFPFSFSIIFISSVVAPCDFTNPSPAFVSCPSLYAISTEGPTLFLSKSSCFSAKSFIIAVTLLGVLNDSISENLILSDFNSFSIIFFRSFSAWSTYRAGNSSNPISKRKFNFFTPFGTLFIFFHFLFISHIFLQIFPQIPLLSKCVHF